MRNYRANMGAGAVSRTIGISSRKISHASPADWELRAGWGSEEARLPYLDRQGGRWSLCSLEVLLNSHHTNGLLGLN